MSINTQKIGQSVLDNVVRFQDLITSPNLLIGVKYQFQKDVSNQQEVRRLETNDKAPMRFIYRDSSSHALIKISSFDFNSFMFNEKTFNEYFVLYPTEHVDTWIAPHFSITKISHMLADKSFTDGGEAQAELDLKKPIYRYPLYCHIGIDDYNAKRAKAYEDAGKPDNFRAPAKFIDKCRKTALKEDSIGKHFKMLTVDCPLLQVDDAMVATYKASLAVAE
jgi:hypothetical protein